MGNDKSNEAKNAAKINEANRNMIQMANRTKVKVLGHQNNACRIFEMKKHN